MPPRVRERDLRRRYGLTLEGFAAMWRDAGGKCEVCRAGLRPGLGGYAVDHHHGSGRVRGLLCEPCNVALGAARECPDRLHRLAGYARLHQTADGETA